MVSLSPFLVGIVGKEAEMRGRISPGSRAIRGGDILGDGVKLGSGEEEGCDFLVGFAGGLGVDVAN